MIRPNKTNAADDLIKLFSTDKKVILKVVSYWLVRNDNKVAILAGAGNEVCHFNRNIAKCVFLKRTQADPSTTDPIILIWIGLQFDGQ